MDDALKQSLLKFAQRRIVSMLGAAGVTVSDGWVMETLSVALMVGNEIYQWWQSHKAEKHKVAGTFDPLKS